MMLMLSYAALTSRRTGMCGRRFGRNILFTSSGLILNVAAELAQVLPYICLR